MLAVELHVHSELSYDGRDPVESLLDRARDVGLDALAVTDHDEIAASLEAADLASEYDLVGIPGLEVTTQAGHLLALGVREQIPAGDPFEETLDRVHDAGGVAVVPHPFQKARHGVASKVSRAALASADAIEVYNSRLLTGLANRRAERFAVEHGVPMTAGSDAHISRMVGRAPTVVDADAATADAVLDAIRAGRTSVEGRRTPWRVSFRQAAGGVKRKFRDRLTAILE